MADKFISQAINVMIADGLTPLARSMFLAEVAKQGVEDLILAGRATPKYRRFVDGIEGIPEEAVSADGTILYRFSYLGEIVAFIVAFLRARSPVRSGRYRDSFMVSVNGDAYTADGFDPDMLQPSDDVFIYNKLPYSRKIDVQLIGNKKLTFSRPPGLFDDAVSAVNRQFGNMVKCRRLYTVRHPEEVSTLKGKRVEYPAIEINMR